MAGTDVPSRLSVWWTWPAFLASSWTWCIGLYLPLLLRDRYGWPAVLAFALPNVLGVVLFGLALRTVEASRAMVAAHRPAMVLFSAVTVAFHAYFLGWIWRAEMGANWLESMLVSVATLSLAYPLVGLGDVAIRRLGAGLYVLSLALLLITLGDTFIGDELRLERRPVWPPGEPAATVFLAPAMAIGFLLCPYFDLTFHRAYRGSGGGGNGGVVFSMFGALFSLMLVYSALYSIVGIGRWVALHILLQSWFTTGIHWREMDRAAWPTQGAWRAKLTWLPVLALFLAPLPLVDYRQWLVFYGLVFPAHAAVIGLRRRLARRPVDVLVYVGFVLLALPFYTFGFLADMEWLLIVPVVTLIVWVAAGPSVIEAESAESLESALERRAPGQP